MLEQLWNNEERLNKILALIEEEVWEQVKDPTQSTMIEGRRDYQILTELTLSELNMHMAWKNISHIREWEANQKRIEAMTKSEGVQDS